VFEKLMSGGQTGVDRAALDIARELGIASAGWCPQGRRAEDGRLQECYPLKETPTAEYAQRTEWNIRDSDGTLVLTRGRPSEGTAFTIEITRRLGKPCLVLDVAENPDASQVRAWARMHQVRVLNVAGPRESKCPGIYQHAYTFLRQVLAGSQNSQGEKSGGASPA
jgi:putative molybdenum carrier protein